jgi:hypothetical protein
MMRKVPEYSAVLPGFGLCTGYAYSTLFAEVQIISFKAEIRAYKYGELVIILEQVLLTGRI